MIQMNEKKIRKSNGSKDKSCKRQTHKKYPLNRLEESTQDDMRSEAPVKLTVPPSAGSAEDGAYFQMMCASTSVASLGSARGGGLCGGGGRASSS